MTPALPPSSAAQGTSKSGLRDATAGRPDQGSETQAFEGVLAQVDESAGASASAGSGLPTFQRPVQLIGKGAPATTPTTPTASGPNKSSLFTLLDRTPTDEFSDQKGSGKSRPAKDDEAAAPTTTPAADPIGNMAMTAASTVLQQSPRTTQMPAGSATVGNGVRRGTISDDVNPAVAGGTPQVAARTVVSNVKLETHIDIAAAPSSITKGAATDSNRADPRVATDSASKSSIDLTEATAPEPTPPSKIDNATIVVPATTTPIQAITNAVAAGAPASSASATSSGATSPVVLTPPRTMTLQLTPADMGTVNVTMHLVGQALDLQLAVSDKDTLGSLSRDRDSLSKAVQDQGYELRSLVIQGADPSAPSSGDGNASSRDQPNNGLASGSNEQGSPASGGGGNHSNQNGPAQRDARTLRTQPDETSRASAAPGAGAFFV